MYPENSWATSFRFGEEDWEIFELVFY